MGREIDGVKVVRLYLVPKDTTPSLSASLSASTMFPHKSSYPPFSVPPLVPSTPTGSPIPAHSEFHKFMDAIVKPTASLLDVFKTDTTEPKHSPSEAKPEPVPRPTKNLYEPVYICDGCGAHPIVGNVNQCDVCYDFHLCDACVKNKVHADFHHKFTINPQINPTFKPKVPEPVPVPAPVISKPAVPLVNVPVTSPNKVGVIESTLVPKHLSVPVEEYEATFVADVTIPDGTKMTVGTPFTKVWRLCNSGNTTWPLGCKLTLLHNTGVKLSTVESIDIPDQVPKGSSVTIAVEMEVPQQEGRHMSFWRMQDPSGRFFGHRIWTGIIATPKEEVVPAPVPPKTAIEAPAPPPIDPNDKYATELQKLENMGFCNRELNRNLLNANNGNVSATIDQLLQYA